MKISQLDKRFMLDIRYADQTLLDVKRYPMSHSYHHQRRADAIPFLKKYIPYVTHDYLHVQAKKDYRNERFVVYTAFDLYCSMRGYSLAEKFYLGCYLFSDLALQRSRYNSNYTGESPMVRFLVDYGGMPKHEHRFMDVLTNCSDADRDTIFQCLSRRYQHFNSIPRRGINMFDKEYPFTCDLTAPSAPIRKDEEVGYYLNWRPEGYHREMLNWVNGDAVDLTQLVVRSADPHTGEWLEDKPEHECLPDFSCCSDAVVAWDKETRKAFADASPEDRQDMLMNALSHMVSKELDDEDDPNVLVVDGKGDEHEIH